MTVTGEQVRAAVEAAGITRIDSRNCSICGSGLYFSVSGGQLYFNSACDCTYDRSPPDPRTWDSAAHWINMQTNPARRAELAAKFGLTLDPVPL